MLYPAFGKHCAEQGTCKVKISRETAKEKSLFLKKKQRFFVGLVPMKDAARKKTQKAQSRNKQTVIFK